MDTAVDFIKNSVHLPSGISDVITPYVLIKTRTAEKRFCAFCGTLITPKATGEGAWEFKCNCEDARDAMKQLVQIAQRTLELKNERAKLEQTVQQKALSVFKAQYHIIQEDRAVALQDADDALLNIEQLS
jgi:DNA-directed RNA polymerase subunit M/transcription elongation factor TFIIS